MQRHAFLCFLNQSHEKLACQNQRLFIFIYTDQKRPQAQLNVNLTLIGQKGTGCGLL
jgi:hypothetical protein